MSRQKETANRSRAGEVQRAQDVQHDVHSSEIGQPERDSLLEFVRQDSVEAHASMLNQASGGSLAHNSLLRLQRQHGNRYVQRVVAVNRKEAGGMDASPEVEATIESARSSGRPLDSTARRQMESAFGADFNGVRIHTDSRADALNNSLNAIAFTTGRDIFFSANSYDPGSTKGRELLAHELTHVVQQSGGGIRAKLAIGEPGDQAEEEANRVAGEVVRKLGSGSSAPARRAGGSARGRTLQRKCACGSHTSSGSECEACRAKRLSLMHGGASQASNTRSIDNEDDIAETLSGMVQRQDDEESDGGQEGAGQQGGGQEEGPQTETVTTCTPTARFTSIPSGTLTPVFGSGRFGVPFRMNAQFTAPIPCTCVPGEYRQYVRGFFKVNGTSLAHSLCSNAMSTTTFNEDCATVGGTDLKYGYHSIPFATSTFTNPDQATGCTFNGSDFPGIRTGSLSTGDTVQIHLDFRGDLVDTSSAGTVLVSSSWTVDGSGTVP